MIKEQFEMSANTINALFGLLPKATAEQSSRIGIVFSDDIADEERIVVLKDRSGILPRGVLLDYYESPEKIPEPTFYFDTSCTCEDKCCGEDEGQETEEVDQDVHLINVYLEETSHPIEHHAVNAYTKGDMYCVLDVDGAVYKYPKANIWRVKEY